MGAYGQTLPYGQKNGMKIDLTGLLSRASSYVAAMPPAISGNHGHDAFFAVALALVHGFAFSRAQAWPIMQEFNARCDPPWSEKELEHKLDSAAKVTRHPKPRGYLLGERGPAVAAQAQPAVTELNVDTSEPLPGEKSKKGVPSVPEQLTPDQLAEAQRIAAELAKLHKAGALKSAEDAQFFAHLLKVFGATYAGDL
jgi:hypothetical protein